MSRGHARQVWGMAVLLALGCPRETPQREDAGLAAPAPPCEVSAGSTEAATTTPDGGSVLLPNGRRLSPVGQTVQVGGFPTAVAESPDGRFVYVLDSGYHGARLVALDRATLAVTSTLETPRGQQALVVSATGQEVFLPTGFGDKLLRLSAAEGQLADHGALSLGQSPIALDQSEDGTLLAVAQYDGQSVLVLEEASMAVTRVLSNVGGTPCGVAFSRDARFVVVLLQDRGKAVSLEVSSGRTVGELDIGKNPAAVARAPGKDLFALVAADSDRLTLADLDAAGQLTVRSTLGLGGALDAKRGHMPTGVAFSPDGARAFAALSASNQVAVVDAHNGALTGRIPVGWYPTALAVSRDGASLLVVNGKGHSSLANPDGEYIGRLLVGTLSVIPLPDDATLARWTAQSNANNSAVPEAAPTVHCPPGALPFPVPLAPGDRTPIEHVVLIVRENKTYDAELGDLPTGNGRPDYAIFGEEFTPNLHRLASEFSNLDNFYSDAEVSAQGHLWTTAGYCTDYVERSWIPSYRDNDQRVPLWGITPLGSPEQGFIFDVLDAAGKEFITYGEVVGFQNNNHLDTEFPGKVYDMTVEDVAKASYVAARIQAGILPAFTYLLLPNNHTFGLSPGAQTPGSMVADNDEATGMVVDALSHSPFWRSTVVFIVEDDPQGGADHVDAHRSLCLVVSPYARRGATVSTHYSLLAMWRTIELILGLPPMNDLTAQAPPMLDAFTSNPDVTPYKYETRRIPRATTVESSLLSHRSSRMDFSGPDRAEDLGAILYAWARGQPLPYSLGQEREEDEEDDDDDADR